VTTLTEIKAQAIAFYALGYSYGNKPDSEASRL